MGEGKGIPRWTALASVALITVLALLAPHLQRRRSPRPAPAITPTMPSLEPVVEVWLSTEDRKLRLARQPDIATTTHAASPADVIIDTRVTYQSIVGFGAALTDA